MKALDKNYLSLQFKLEIHTKNGTEFQSFFENIMEKAFSDYQKIRPYGNLGDGGNDGYRKALGVYYQVYAPNEPKLKESEAAKKLQDDFKKLKSNWSKISEIKEYNFVFNDKYGGSVQLLEEAISNLKEDNPNIEFIIFLAKDLEDIFLQLGESDILDLKFHIDRTLAISNAYKYLESVRTELDRENVYFAQNNLIIIKDIILALDDESIFLEYELLECRCLQKLERVDEARDKYINISKRFPKDPRAFLYLAGIFLHDEDFSENKKLLEKAENIDNDYWLLKLEKLVRKNNLGEEIDVKNIDENTFTDDPKIKADFYRLYAIFFEQSGDKTNADSFIEKAIHLNPDRFANYSAKLSILESRLHSNQDNTEILTESQELLEETTKVEKKFLEYGDIGPRNKAILNSKRLFALLIQEDFPKLRSVAKETFQLFISCYLDKEIEQLLTQSLQFVLLSDTEFNQMLEYLKNSKLVISDEISKVLIFQFNINNNLLTDGKKFFEEINNLKFSEFIRDIEKENHERILEFLNSDPMFAVTMANTLREHPELRKKIIHNLPDDKNIQKNKLLVLLNYDEKDVDEAFNILKQFDLSNLSYLDCLHILQITKEKKAWDFEIIVLEKLLAKPKNEKDRFNLQLDLFDAYLNLKKYPEVIELGEELLQESFDKDITVTSNKEAILQNTIIACIERGKIDQDAFKRAKKLIEEYKLTEPSFEFKVGLEAEVYIKNNDADNALKSVIEGLKIRKSLTPIEYAKLYYLLAIRISQQIDLNLDSLDRVLENTLVKFRNKDEWYFIGNDIELDTIPISKTSNKYEFFIDKKIGDRIVFKGEYGSEDLEYVVDKIFSIEKYALWKVVENFHNLTKEGLLEGFQMIKVPQEEETVDTKYLLKFLQDLQEKTEPFFKEYCKKPFPLSMLAVSEGSLTHAISRIQNEQKGYINCSTGTIDEFSKQKQIAKKIIANKMPFYLDGTSAIFLSKIGLYKEVHTYLPNLKVPQSVISLLANIADQFGYKSGQAGQMSYAQGRISISLLDKDKKDKKDLIQSNFIQSIKLLESNSENIEVISLANKAECFSEQEIPAELIDACILAQKQGFPIMTDDYINLKLNEIQTNKKAPDYFSSFALIRVLYEEHKISFDQYLKYFGFLSSYRFRFLSLNSDDIEKAVLGDGDILIFKPENIRNLNFPLTLSQEYGVSFENAFSLVLQFLLKILIENSITPEIAERIFIEILECFPSKMNKGDFGEMLLRSCVKIIEQNQSEFLISPINEILNQKIDKLQQALEIYK